MQAVPTTAVARRDDEERPGLGRQVVHRGFERVDTGGVDAAEAHADDLGVHLGGRPLHAGEDRRPGAAVLAADLALGQLRAGCHALAQPAGGRSAARDGRGHVGAVSDVVVHRALADEVGGSDDRALEVGVVDVVAGVENGDGDPRAGEPRLPRGRGRRSGARCVPARPSFGGPARACRGHREAGGRSSRRR